MGGQDSILESKDKYSSLFLSMISFAAVFIPVIMIGYAFLAQNGLATKSSLYSDQVTLLLCLTIIGISLVQFFTSNVKTSLRWSERLIFFYVIVYHVLGASFLLYVSGFLQAPSMFWLPLMVVSNLYYGRKGLVYSGAALLATTFIALAFDPNPTLSLVLNHLVYVFVIIALSIFTSLLKKVHSTEHTDLVRSQKIQGRQRGQLESLVNSINEAIVSVNTTGHIQTYNAATLNLFDTNQSLTGKHIDDVVHLYEHNGDPQKLSMLLKGNASFANDELSHHFSDGEMMRLGITVSVVRNKNEVQGYIVLFRDITKSKSLEEERDEFIAVISHELRTPITVTEGAISNVQLLMERGADKSLLSNTLKSAHEQVVYLAQMVNDLSTLSRAERGVTDDQEVIDVNALLHDLYSQYQSHAEQKKLTLDLDIRGKLDNVFASRLYLEEILQNFITNAIKYTDKGSVTIIAKSSKGLIEFSVTDTGIGISKSDQKKVFDKFYRSEDYRTRETSGTGLGLYVVQKLSHKLGTHIQLQSRLNHGSTFSFTLPSTDQELVDNIDVSSR